ncbi:hypothetical protein V8C35DRAFT_333011 [Trichoderma chlorosporum]
MELNLHFSSFNFTTSKQPSPSAPLGTFPGATSADGENWVGFLTVSYNASVFLSYDLAVGGATLDSTLVAPASPSIRSVRQQIQDEFIPGYVSPKTAPSPPEWTGSNTLFAIWIGINDIGATFAEGTTEANSIDQQIFTEYLQLIDQLYTSGARNLVLISVPTIDRSPGTIARGPTVAEQEKSNVVQWNQQLVSMAEDTKSNHADMNLWIFDANALFTQLLNNITSFPQTAGIKNTTQFCTAYENGTPTPDFFDPSCGVPVNDYFWLNSLHPRSPVHDVVAQVLSRELLAGPNIC